MKNANQINVNQINNINLKETIYVKKKEFIKNNIENKQNSFLIKRENNINNALLEIIHKKSKANKNLKEMKSKTINDISTTKPNKIILLNNNENINSNNKNENISGNINVIINVNKYKCNNKCE